MENSEANVDEWQKFFDERIKRSGPLVDGYLRYVSRISASGVPPLFELRHISKILGIDEGLLVSMINRTDQFYREFEIAKKRGGVRNIGVPSPTLLYVQRWILSEILSKMETHDAAHGYIAGRSVVSNANVHRSSRMILKMDLKEFFPSIKFKRVVKIFLSFGYPVGVSFFLASFCCHKKKLPQGAATSPTLSNLIAKRLDTSLCTYSQQRGLIYSRYADDLVFSGDRVGKEDITQIIFLIVRNGFEVNEKKTQIIGENRKKIVTGVSISDGTLNLPRKTRREIQSHVYRLAKFGYMKFSEQSGVLDPMIYERVLGRIGFWLQIDPQNPTAHKLQSIMQQEISLNEHRFAGLFPSLPSVESFANSKGHRLEKRLPL